MTGPRDLSYKATQPLDPCGSHDSRAAHRFGRHPGRKAFPLLIVKRLKELKIFHQIRPAGTALPLQRINL